jgi:phosphotransferase family enzyme
MGEQPLSGGVDNIDAVVRVGDTVPRPPTSPAVRAFLTHLAGAGFAGAPRWWASTSGAATSSTSSRVRSPPAVSGMVGAEQLLVSVARLQRELRAAAAGFRLPDYMTWPRRRVPDGDLVCHTALCLENVVVRDGRPVAFLDFEMAHPVDPLFDIASRPSLGAAA